MCTMLIQILSCGQPDPNAAGRHHRAPQAGALLRDDLQRDVVVHAERVRGVRVLPVPLLPLLLRRAPPAAIHQSTRSFRRCSSHSPPIPYSPKLIMKIQSGSAQLNGHSGSLLILIILEIRTKAHKVRLLLYIDK